MRTFAPATVGATMLALVLFQAGPTLQEPSGPVQLAATGGFEIRQLDGLVDRMRRNGDLRVVRTENDPLLPSRSHERLAQYHLGVRIFGADISRQTDRGITVSIFGTLHTKISVNATPTLDADEALAAVEEQFDGHMVSEIRPDLMVLRHPTTGVYHLAYRTRGWSSDGLMSCFVDAHTGALLWEYNNLMTQDAVLPCADCTVGQGLGVQGDRKKISARRTAGTFRAQDGLRPSSIVTYDMRGNWSRTWDFVNGLTTIFDSDLAADSDNNWQDGANVDAHTGAGWTYDYLYHRFGRRGLNGNNGRILSIVHPVSRFDLYNVPPVIQRLFHLNAFFCDCIPEGLVVYGEGLPPGIRLTTGQSVTFFSGGFDIVVHELAHGVTHFSSQLISANESGALNEAFSDIVAVGAEFFMANSGRHPVEKPDYLIGEDVVKPGGLRNLANPSALGDPDHYSVRFTGDEDRGGVHTNALIAGHAFYLAIEGGTNRTSSLSVTGVGAANRAQIEQVFFRAFTQLLPADATFLTARIATIQSARDLFGAGSAAEQAVTAAWTAVGVE